MKTLFLALLLVLAQFASALEIAHSSADEEVQRKEKLFADNYIKALQNADTKAYREIVFWDGIPPHIEETLIRSFLEGTKLKIRKATFSNPEEGEWSDGTRLEIVRIFKIDYDIESQRTSTGRFEPGLLGHVIPLGVHRGRLFITEIYSENQSTTSRSRTTR